MSRPFKLICFGILLFWFLFPLVVISQVVADPETEYLRIRTMAFNGEYKKSGDEARKLVNDFPEYGDARILLGRILAWQKNYVDALAVIDTLLVTDPENSDALAARFDISLWMNETTPVTTELKTGYFFDRFSLPYGRYWQIFNAGAGHKFKWGKGSAGLNIGDLSASGSPSVNATELQFEVEAWPKISAKNYAFASYAYSPGTYFPHHRAAFEIWQILPVGWAVSAGCNYFYFDKNIFIANASVEKYLGKYWFSAKEYFYFKEKGITTSFYLNGRRYYGDTDYFQATLGIGSAPDEPFDIQTDLMRLSAYSLRLAYNFKVKPRINLRLGAGYSSEEYSENLHRNRFEGGINLVYSLKSK